MKEKEKHIDLSNEDGSISLKKFLIHHPLNRPLTLLVDGSGNGIAKDEENIFYITSEMCQTQADYNLFTKGKVWNGVEKYMKMFFKKEVEDGTFDYEKKLSAAKHSPELKQIIGMITILGSVMNMGNKAGGKRVPIYIEHPETHLHPSRQSAFVTFFFEITKDFGWNLDEIKKPIKDKL